MMRLTTTRWLLAAGGLAVLSPACTCGAPPGEGEGEEGEGEEGEGEEGEGEEGEGEEGEGEEGEGEEGEGEGEPVLGADSASSGLTLPFDAAPSPDGATIYYTAVGSNPDLGHSLWSVPADGAAAATELETEFTSPLALAVSSDGDTVFVADSGFDTGSGDDGEEDVGAIFTVAAAGGDKAEVAGSYGFSARGLDVRGDVVFFTGRDPADGVVGVFVIEDGAIGSVRKGDPFTDPSGLAVSADDDGDIYVVDTSAGASKGSIIRLAGTPAVATTFVTDLDVGYPAGAALSRDEATLYVSGLQNGDEEREAVVFSIDTGSGAIRGDVVPGNDEAGGLHRAKDTDDFAWAGRNDVFHVTFE